jgi:hypothetical protein
MASKRYRILCLIPWLDIEFQKPFEIFRGIKALLSFFCLMERSLSTSITGGEARPGKRAGVLAE